MNTKAKIQSLWIGEELSKLEQLSITSFLDHGHDYILYTYNDINGVPDGTILKDANEIISSSKIFKYRNRDSYAGFSNLFRYKLLLEKGGFWVDADIVCLRPFNFKTSHLIASENIKISNKNSVNKRPVKITNCVMKAPPGSEIMEYCYQTAGKRDPHELGWGETGPDLVHQAFIEHNMTRHVAKPNVFCPINWWEWDQFIHGPLALQFINNLIPFKKSPYPFYNGEIRSQLVNKLKCYVHDPYAYHFWNEMWRRNSIDKNGKFSRYSTYEKLKKKHGVQ